LELQSASAAHVYRTPYGAVVELNHGTAFFTTPGGHEMRVGSESHSVEEGKAYRVHAVNEISYHLSPDVDEYHEYHSHKPCAPVQMVKGHSPIAAGQSRFMLVTGIVAGGLTAWGVTEALGSPTRP
jgi:hypothetical protein